jgi:hypothetical protein
MQTQNRLDSPRWELATAIVIAIVSLTTALAVWWTSTIASRAADYSRQGLIDAIKVQAGANEDWRKAYEEAASAARFSTYAAEAEALVASADPAAQARGENIRTYLLPNLQLPAAPLATDPVYALPNGAYDIARRIEDLQAGSDLAALEPEASFARGDRMASQQRWLVIGSVLLAISLFWLAVAQISHARRRALTFLVGLAFFGAGVSWLLIVGAVYALFSGGAL